MKKKQFDTHMQDIEREMSAKNRTGDLARARGLSVGTAFGGVTEIIMRGDSNYMWTTMQPVEVIELIHQLAANVGCHLQLTPRKDFASWRDWKYTDEELLQYRGQQTQPGVGWAPHVNDMAPHMQVGANLPPPEQQPGMKFETPVKEHENVVATKKTVDRRNTKRASKAS